MITKREIFEALKGWDAAFDRCNGPRGLVYDWEAEVELLIGDNGEITATALFDGDEYGLSLIGFRIGLLEVTPTQAALMMAPQYGIAEAIRDAFRKIEADAAPEWFEWIETPAQIRGAV